MFIERDNGGNVSATHTEQQYIGQEELTGAELTAHLLGVAQADRIAVMKTAWNDAVSTGFTTNSILMQTDADRVTQLKQGYDLAILESEGTMDLIALDNTLHTSIAVADVLIMIRALGVNARTLLLQFNARRNSIIAAADIAAVNAVTW